jgi:hypothetical protein
MKLLLAIVCFVGVTGAAQTNQSFLSKTYADKGQLIITNLNSAPFPHSKRAEGHKYKQKDYSAAEHYSDNTVAIFIPKGFRKKGPWDFVIHFHGWNNNVAGVLKHYQLIEQLVQSGKNAVLIVPQGPMNAPDSFGGRLEDTNGFKRFMADVAAGLREQVVPNARGIEVGRVILSGHSGGYQVISSIIDHGGMSKEISEVWLFDALYAQTDKFSTWQAKQHGRLLNIYTEHGGTKGETEKMMATLKERGVKFVSGNEAEIKASDLAFQGPVFIFTALEHDDVPFKNKTFLKFLQTSSLEPTESRGNQ